MSTYRDIATINRIKRGDERAFRILFDGLSNRIYTYAFRFFRDRALAEETVQDVFMRVWQNRERLDAGRSVQAYIYAIARTQVFNQLKRAVHDRKLKEHIFYDAVRVYNPVEEKYAHKELMGFYEKAVALLPEQRQIVFRMSREEGFSHTEIAEKLGISQNTVKNQIVKASRFIREYLHTHTEISTSLIWVFLAVFNSRIL